MYPNEHLAIILLIHVKQHSVRNLPKFAAVSPKKRAVVARKTLVHTMEIYEKETVIGKKKNRLTIARKRYNTKE